MKFDKNYDYPNIFNNIQSSSFYHWPFPVRIDTKSHTKYWTRSVGDEKI